MSGKDIPDFDVAAYVDEYMNADPSVLDETFLGKFILASMSHKSMITNKIFTSGNILAGFSIDYNKQGFRGIKAYKKLVEQSMRNMT